MKHSVRIDVIVGAVVVACSLAISLTVALADALFLRFGPGIWVLFLVGWALVTACMLRAQRVAGPRRAVLVLLLASVAFLAGGVAFAGGSGGAGHVLLVSVGLHTLLVAVGLGTLVHALIVACLPRAAVDVGETTPAFAEPDAVEAHARR